VTETTALCDRGNHKKCPFCEPNLGKTVREPCACSCHQTPPRPDRALVSPEERAIWDNHAARVERERNVLPTPLNKARDAHETETIARFVAARKQRERNLVGTCRECGVDLIDGVALCVACSERLKAPGSLAAAREAGNPCRSLDPFGVVRSSRGPCALPSGHAGAHLWQRDVGAAQAIMDLVDAAGGIEPLNRALEAQGAPVRFVERAP
jgi:hypothetical protein